MVLVANSLCSRSFLCLQGLRKKFCLPGPVSHWLLLHLTVVTRVGSGLLGSYLTSRSGFSGITENPACHRRIYFGNVQSELVMSDSTNTGIAGNLAESGYCTPRMSFLPTALHRGLESTGVLDHQSCFDAIVFPTQTGRYPRTRVCLTVLSMPSTRPEPTIKYVPSPRIWAGLCLL